MKSLIRKHYSFSGKGSYSGENLQRRMDFQALDVNILKGNHEDYVEVETAFLLYMGGIPNNLNFISFCFEIYRSRCKLFKVLNCIYSI